MRVADLVEAWKATVRLTRRPNTVVEMVDGGYGRFQGGNAAVGEALGHAIVSKLTMKLTFETYFKPE
jgi:hypothetical protein